MRFGNRRANILPERFRAMLTAFGLVIFALGVFVGVLAIFAPASTLDSMLAHDPEYVQLDGAARERARRGARFFGVFLFLVGLAGLWAVLIDALGPDQSGF